MLKTAMVLGSIFLGSTAHAAKLTCTGEIMGYNLLLRANMQGAKFTSRANVTISQGAEVIKALSMRVTRSTFVAGQRLALRATSSDGNIKLETSYAGNGLYTGNVDASGPQGNITVGANCRVR